MSRTWCYEVYNCSVLANPPERRLNTLMLSKEEEEHTFEKRIFGGSVYSTHDDASPRRRAKPKCGRMTPFPRDINNSLIGLSGLERT